MELQGRGQALGRRRCGPRKARSRRLTMWAARSKPRSTATAVPRGGRRGGWRDRRGPARQTLHSAARGVRARAAALAPQRPPLRQWQALRLSISYSRPLRGRSNPKRGPRDISGSAWQPGGLWLSAATVERPGLLTAGFIPSESSFRNRCGCRVDRAQSHRRARYGLKWRRHRRGRGG